MKHGLKLWQIITQGEVGVPLQGNRKKQGFFTDRHKGCTHVFRMPSLYQTLTVQNSGGTAAKMLPWSYTLAICVRPDLSGLHFHDDLNSLRVRKQAICPTLLHAYAPVFCEGNHIN